MNKNCLEFLLAAVALIILPTTIRATQPDDNFSIKNIYSIDRGHSYVGFQVKYMGYAKVRGRFTDFNGSLYYDPTDISRTSATVIIKTESIDTELAWRDKDLRSDNWFDVEIYPTIKFQTTGMQKTDAGISFFGDLTMHGVTKVISLELQDHSGVMNDVRGDSQVIFVGKTRINRNDFGVRGENWSRIKEGLAAVAAEVEIELTVLGKRINEDNFRNWVRDAERPPGRIYKVISEDGMSAGLAEFEKMLANPEIDLNSAALNIAGYMLLKEGKVEDAITAFRHNISVFPDIGNNYDSLGEAYANAGNFPEAAASYRQALEKDSLNANAIEILRHLSK